MIYYNVKTGIIRCIVDAATVDENVHESVWCVARTGMMPQM